MPEPRDREETLEEALERAARAVRQIRYALEGPAVPPRDRRELTLIQGGLTLIQGGDSDG